MSLLYALRILLIPEPGCSTSPTSLNTRIRSRLRGILLNWHASSHDVIDQFRYINLKSIKIVLRTFSRISREITHTR